MLFTRHDGVYALWSESNKQIKQLMYRIPFYVNAIM
jgi:hypothetical protein